MRRSLLLMMLVMGITACVKKPLPEAPKKEEPPVSGKVNIDIEHIFGSSDLVLNDKWYITENGDSLKIKTYAYFISNVKLHATDGKVYAEEESYHLINEEKPTSKTFTISGVPFSKYDKISFLIGVDSARNVSGAQTGALDQSTGMFWDWNTGYIMTKLEGESPQSSISSVIYHLGGYSGNVNVLRTITLTLPKQIDVTVTNTPAIHFKNDVSEWFKTPNTINLMDMSFFQNSGDMLKLADNYVDMFSVDHVE